MVAVVLVCIALHPFVAHVFLIYIQSHYKGGFVDRGGTDGQDDDGESK